MAPVYCKGPSRLIFEETDPRGHAELVRFMSEHSAEGSALTLLGVHARRIPESQADALIAAVKAKALRPRFTAR
jgi:hypothetical protein